MAGKKINELTDKTPVNSDLLPVADPSTGVAGKSTALQVVTAGLPSQTGNSGKFLTTNGATASWGAATVNLSTGASGILPVTNGGTGTSTGSITGTGALTFAAGGTNQNITLNPSGTGDAYINQMRINHYTHPNTAFGIITTIQRESLIASGNPGSTLIKGPNATANGDGGSIQLLPGNKAGTGVKGTVSIDSLKISGQNQLNQVNCVIGGNSNNDTQSVAIGEASGTYNSVNNLSEGRCVFIGYQAGTYQSDGATPTSNTTNSIYIGERVKSSGNSDTNAIAIGSNCAGEGSNTTVIGNTSTSYTKLHGYTKSKSLQETVYTITDGSSVDINPANGGIQVWTLGANRTPTASSFAEGQSVTLMVDDGTAYAITWSSISPTWVGGSAPTLATTGYTVIELWKRSSTIYGALVGNA